MKKLFFYLFVLVAGLSSCSKETKEEQQTQAPEKVVYWYIYDSLSGKDVPADSLMLVESSDLRTLELYRSTDSLSKTVEGMKHLSVFQLNGDKFAVIIDSTFKVFKFSNTSIDLLFTLDISVGLPPVKIKKVDLNSDGNRDVLMQIPSGGTYGDDYIFLLYDPQLRSLKAKPYRNKGGASSGS